MKIRYRFVLIAALISAAAGFYLGWQAEEKPPLASNLVGKPAPMFSLTQVTDPNQVLTAEAFRGKVSLLNVWGAWCASCVEEHPFLTQLAAQKTVALYGLNFLDSLSQAQNYLTKYGNPFIACAFDEHGALAESYQLNSAPITYLIDANGVIRYRHQGILKPAFFEQQILPLIRQLEKERDLSSN